jgi:hypothetical protein
VELLLEEQGSLLYTLFFGEQIEKAEREIESTGEIL